MEFGLAVAGLWELALVVKEFALVVKEFALEFWFIQEVVMELTNHQF